MKKGKESVMGCGRLFNPLKSSTAKLATFQLPKLSNAIQKRRLENTVAGYAPLVSSSKSSFRQLKGSHSQFSRYCDKT
jgi:hypothetical protein